MWFRAGLCKYWKSVSQYHSQIYLIASLHLVSVMTTFSSKLQNETSLNRKKKGGEHRHYVPYIWARAAYKQEVTCCKLFKERKKSFFKQINIPKQQLKPTSMFQMSYSEKGCFSYKHHNQRSHSLYFKRKRLGCKGPLQYFLYSRVLLRRHLAVQWWLSGCWAAVPPA